MADPNPKAETALQRRGVEDVAVATMDTERFNHMHRVATAIADQSLLPDHLKVHPWWDPKGNLAPAVREQKFKELGQEAWDRGLDVARRATIANCFRVVNQAIRWGMDPFAVVDTTYVVGGKMGWEGKLVAAVINARADLDGRLEYTHTGGKDAKNLDDMTCTCSGTIRGEGKVRSVTVRLGDVKTDNQMYKNPLKAEQKLCYVAATWWARRHTPEILMGVLTVEDLELIAEREKLVGSGRSRGAEQEISAAALIAGEETKAVAAVPDAPAEEKPPAAPSLLATDAAIQRVLEQHRARGIDDEVMIGLAVDAFGVQSFADLTADQLAQLHAELLGMEPGAPSAEPEPPPPAAPPPDPPATLGATGFERILAQAEGAGVTRDDAYRRAQKVLHRHGAASYEALPVSASQDLLAVMTRP